MSTKAEERSNQAVQNVRPLNATQSRNLEKLVDADFKSVKTEIDDTIRREITAAKARVEEEWKARGTSVSDWTEKADKLVAKQRKARKDLSDEAKAAGVNLIWSSGRYGENVFSVQVAGLDEALRKAEVEVRERGRDVLNALERAQLQAQRKVLVASITAQAEEILASIPDAKTLLSEQSFPVTKTEQITS